MNTSDYWTSVSYEVRDLEARSVLRKWREEHARRSEKVVEIWEHVLSRYSSHLRDELWAVLEQVTIAALDSARQDVAIDCLQTLNKRFPKSHRVTKLQAMRLESLGRYDDALYLYEKLLGADEANTIYWGRKIAVLLAKGDRQGAIQELDTYLHTFVNDHEAWVQLGELHVLEGDYAKAVFCFEELLISNPYNTAYLCRLGKLRYTMGGAENVEIARAYYAKCAQLAVTGASAFYGLMLCCNQLLPKATAAKRKELVSCGLDASNKLIALYEATPPVSTNNKNDSQQLNPTIVLQLAVVHSMRSQFKD